MIEVSVVISSYNSESTIARAIGSVLTQDYPENLFELIVVDDGSTDDTLAVINKTIAEANARSVKTSIIQKENGGTASARNAGFAASLGKYVGYLDSDDAYLRNKILESVKYFEFGPNIGIVYSDYIAESPENSESKETKGLNMKFPYSWSRLINQCIISTNSFVLREAWEKVGGFDESFSLIEDYDLWVRICASGYVARHIPKHLFIYNDRPNNKTNTDRLNGFSLIGEESGRIRNKILKGDFYVQNS